MSLSEGLEDGQGLAMPIMGGTPGREETVQRSEGPDMVECAPGTAWGTPHYRESGFWCPRDKGAAPIPLVSAGRGRILAFIKNEFRVVRGLHTEEQHDLICFKQDRQLWSGEYFT